MNASKVETGNAFNHHNKGMQPRKSRTECGNGCSYTDLGVLPVIGGITAMAMPYNWNGCGSRTTATVTFRSVNGTTYLTLNENGQAAGCYINFQRFLDAGLGFPG